MFMLFCYSAVIKFLLNFKGAKENKICLKNSKWIYLNFNTRNSCLKRFHVKENEILGLEYENLR